MENLRKLWLLGPDGKPLDERLRTLFGRLLPKFLRRFPAFQDAAEIQNHGEEAIRRFQQKEKQSGQEIEKPWGYAWKALESVGISAGRTNEMQVRFRTVESGSDAPIVSQLRAWDGSVEQIEQGILLRELEKLMKPDEVWMFRRKAAGFTHAEIAREKGCSVNAVDQAMSRLIRKIRALVDVKE